MQNIPIDVIRYMISFLDYESRINANMIFLDDSRDRVVKSIKQNALSHELIVIVKTCAMYLSDSNTSDETGYLHHPYDARRADKYARRLRIKMAMLLFQYLLKKKDFLTYLGPRFINCVQIKANEILEEVKNNRVRHLKRKTKYLLMNVIYSLNTIINTLHPCSHKCEAIQVI
jgi:hypothetical protein